MKIYTKSGDAGTTGLYAGPRVFKDDARIEAYGTVDELNAYLGIAASGLSSETANIGLHQDHLSSFIKQIQSDLFCMGAELATPEPDEQGMRLFPVAHIQSLEAAIDSAEAKLPSLTNFILPGGSLSAAHFHFARTVCRRAERNLVTLTRIDGVADYSQLVIYLNRLGDFLFVIARLINQESGCSEPIWQKPL